MFTTNELGSLIGLFAEPSAVNIQEDFQQFILFRYPYAKLLILMQAFSLSEISSLSVEDVAGITLPTNINSSTQIFDEYTASMIY